MLDTSNICIYVIKNRLAALQSGPINFAEALCISTITLGELLCGAEKSARRSQNLEAVEQFTARPEVLPFSATAAPHFGRIRAGLPWSGRLCGTYDMLIAAHARSEDLILVNQ
jgi:tRNA(fMet)-specific endonuclease VapC